MKTIKTNVVNFTDFAWKSNSKCKNPAHASDVVKTNTYTPIAFTIQNHLTNLRLTYGDDVVREVVQLMGLDSKKEAS